MLIDKYFLKVQLLKIMLIDITRKTTQDKYTSYRVFFYFVHYLMNNEYHK